MMMMIGLLSGLETKIIIIIIITHTHIYMIFKFLNFYLKFKIFKSAFYKVPSDSVKNGILRG